MAVVTPSSPQTLDGNLNKSDAGNPPLPSSAASPSATSVVTSGPEETPPSDPSNPDPPSTQTNSAPVVLPPPPPVASFRPLGAPPFAPHFSAFSTRMTQNHSFHPMVAGPGVQPPGATPPGSILPPGAVIGAGAVGVQAPPLLPAGSFQMAYGQVPNGYMPVPAHSSLPMPPQGIPRYPTPYLGMIHPGFPPRPMPPPGVIPQLFRPSLPGVRGAPHGVIPIIRPPVSAVVEKPQTTVYVGKIAPTAANEFLFSVLKLCGPVKSWKRPQDPSDGTPKGYGFCEFESAEGVLRSLRLLNKLSIDGQELMLNINQATREYLERYVEKKTEREKLKQLEAGGSEKENENMYGAENHDPPKKAEDERNKDSEDSGVKEKREDKDIFGIVTAEDSEADNDALEKLKSMIEERLKNNPLPPPPSQSTLDGSVKSESEVPSKSRDAAEDKVTEETSSENKASTNNDKQETSSPDRTRRHDSRTRERDRERDVKRGKEKELEKFEKDRERERVWREREREYKIRDVERGFKDRVKDWESREKEREYRRKLEKERERERERERWKEVSRQEEESDDDDLRKRRWRSDIIDEKRKKRQREKYEDLDDRLKEEEEIAEAKRREVEEKPPKDEPVSPRPMEIDNEKLVSQEKDMLIDDDIKPIILSQDHDNGSSFGDKNGYANQGNSKGAETSMTPPSNSDLKLSNSAPARKLGFGLIGSGKRQTVPSVFHEEDDEDVNEKKMKPLVPIDYSTEEMEAVHNNSSDTQPNLTSAAEFAKSISGAYSKEEKPDLDKERTRRSTDKSSLRECDRKDSESTRSRDESREKLHDKGSERNKDRQLRHKTEHKKLLDAKQIIDMIPKTKEELFIYLIDWQTYDKHELHARMKPWISKKITEFLGEEEPTLVEYIVSCTRDHMQPDKMLELLQGILDDEAEMFVLKMWRMMIFEIKKVETGLPPKSKT